MSSPVSAVSSLLLMLLVVVVVVLCFDEVAVVGVSPVPGELCLLSLVAYG